MFHRNPHGARTSGLGGLAVSSPQLASGKFQAVIAVASMTRPANAATVNHGTSLRVCSKRTDVSEKEICTEPKQSPSRVRQSCLARDPQSSIAGNIAHLPRRYGEISCGGTCAAGRELRPNDTLLHANRTNGQSGDERKKNSGAGARRISARPRKANRLHRSKDDGGEDGIREIAQRLGLKKRSHHQDNALSSHGTTDCATRAYIWQLVGLP